MTTIFIKTVFSHLKFMHCRRWLSHKWSDMCTSSLRFSP